MARAPGPCEVLGVTWAAGPRGHRRSADTKEIGFPGPFFTPRREIEPRQQEWRPAPAARKTGPPHLTGLLPRACRPHPVRRRLPQPARRVLAAGQAGRCGTPTPASRPAFGTAAIEPGPPGSHGGARLACHQAARAAAGGGPASRAPARRCAALCRRTWRVPSPGSPPARAGAPGEGRSSARGGSRPGSGQDAALPLVTVASRYRGQPSRFPQPAFRQAARRG